MRVSLIADSHICERLRTIVIRTEVTRPLKVWGREQRKAILQLSLGFAFAFVIGTLLSVAAAAAAGAVAGVSAPSRLGLSFLLLFRCRLRWCCCCCWWRWWLRWWWWWLPFWWSRVKLKNRWFECERKSTYICVSLIRFRSFQISYSVRKRFTN